MLSNLEYLNEFVDRHKFNKKVEIRFNGTVDENYIQSVKFNKEDIKSEYRVSLNDIKYDVDSDLPSDVFLRWIEYLDNGGDKSYIDWMTKMDNQYTPMGIDNSDGEKLREEVENALNTMKRMLGYD